MHPTAATATSSFTICAAVRAPAAGRGNDQPPPHHTTPHPEPFYLFISTIYPTLRAHDLIVKLCAFVFPIVYKTYHIEFFLLRLLVFTFSFKTLPCLTTIVPLGL